MCTSTRDICECDDEASKGKKLSPHLSEHECSQRRVLHTRPTGTTQLTAHVPVKPRLLASSLRAQLFSCHPIPSLRHASQLKEFPRDEELQTGRNADIAREESKVASRLGVFLQNPRDQLQTQEKVNLPTRPSSFPNS